MRIHALQVLLTQRSVNKPSQALVLPNNFVYFGISIFASKGMPIPAYFRTTVAHVSLTRTSQSTPIPCWLCAYSLHFVTYVLSDISRYSFRLNTRSSSAFEGQGPDNSVGIHAVRTRNETRLTAPALWDAQQVGLAAAHSACALARAQRLTLCRFATDARELLRNNYRAQDQRHQL